jgi:hypothetical protein
MTAPELHLEIAWCDAWLTRYGWMAQREANLMERGRVMQGWLDTYCEKSKLQEELERIAA